MFRDPWCLTVCFTDRAGHRAPLAAAGTRAAVRDYADCNVGEVRTNALVTRGGDHLNETEINTVLNLFLHAQQHFGQKFGDQFRWGRNIGDKYTPSRIVLIALIQLTSLPKFPKKSTEKF